jgi:hypothetical protein
MYASETPFRSRIVMVRHGFGRGEYKYFAYPLPPVVAALRTALYPPLAVIANRWNEQLGLPARYPAAHAEYLARCHAAGRPRPAVAGWGRRLWLPAQDPTASTSFPRRWRSCCPRPATTSPARVVLTEQRPRMQSRTRWCCGR